MKKLLLFFAILSFIVIGCTKQEQPEPEVQVSLDYKFTSQSSVISAKAFSPDYDAFYSKYIVGRLLTPATFDITFTDKTTNFSFQTKGKWSSDKLFTLPSGTYEVVGKSVSKYASSGDTCMLVFNETIVISPTTTKIVLTAKYDCALLLFDKNTVSSCVMWFNGAGGNGYGYGSSPEPHTVQKLPAYTSEKFVHIFINSYTPCTTPGYDLWYKLNITRTSGIIAVLDFRTYKFTFGKYYYFGDAGNEYILPPMESIN